MVIYKVFGFNDGAMHAHFTTTKAKAQAYIDEFQEGGVDLGWEAWNVDPTRQGVVQALNDFIEITCFNDGG